MNNDIKARRGFYILLEGNEITHFIAVMDIAGLQPELWHTFILSDNEYDG